MYAIRFLRIYDTGDEIDLHTLEQALDAAHLATRATFTRVKPKSISMEEPPLLVRLPPCSLTGGDKTWSLLVIARIYDIGAVSITLVMEAMDEDPSAIRTPAFRFAGQKGLEELFFSSLSEVRRILYPHLGDLPVDPEFYEDYTIYLTNRTDSSVDPVALLTGEDIPFSNQTREEILKYSLSYGREDTTILSWDTALLISPEPPSDLIELIEFANVQVLELRYYDRVLTRQMEMMYDDIELADRLSRFSRIRLYHILMSRIMETHAEISEITEKVDNLIKITEDIYYARVYATALQVLRSSQWRSGVDRKIAVIRENYRMLSEEVNIQHSNFLEWIIIILIALEFIFAIWQAVRY